jgi:putative flavoprotein involved in K+ transport
MWLSDRVGSKGMECIDTLIIGGGQAGLATSFCLKKQGREHIVLERADRPGAAWQQRWDSFTLVTPNWAFRLPGVEHPGDDRDGFMPRDEILRVFERYAASQKLPVRLGVDVTVVAPLVGRPGYLVRTVSAGTIGSDFEAQNVVVATGMYQRPKIPAFSSALPTDILQLHSGQYRNPASLPPGAVLVVGSGQSGCQIAEELYMNGRRVYHSIGSAGRAPRRYRGKDTYEWLVLAGFFDRTPDMLPSPKARFAPDPHLSGAGGGHTLNLHRFARDGVTLLGHLRGAADGRLDVAPDLHESLSKADQFEAQLVKLIDGYIAKKCLDAPEERLPELRDGFDQAVITDLDVRNAGITSVIWAAGYRLDFSWVKVPTFDEDGYPVQQRGVTRYPGLYFVGLPWLHTRKSGLLLGVGEDAEYVASRIAATSPEPVS